MRPFIHLICIFGSLAISAPLTDRDGTISLPIHYRGLDTRNLDILVPNDDGLLVRSNETAPSNLVLPRQVLGDTNGPQPGDIGTIGNGNCGQSADWSKGCHHFCPIMTQIVRGNVIHATQDINCNIGESCEASFSESTAITQSFSFSFGISAGGGITDAISVGADLGFGYSWTKTTTSGSDRKFNPPKGEVGHIVFVPYLLETCGTMTKFIMSAGTTCGDWTRKDVKAVESFDPMSCAQAGFALNGGPTAGIYSWCNINTGAGCG